MSGSYLFDNAGIQATGRFTNTHPLYDPPTMQLLDNCGIGEGSRCFEVGAGGGSIAAWMAERVGPMGYVLVTDLDPRHLAEVEALNLPNVEVRQHDIGKDPLPEKDFDIIHSRFVIMHVPERHVVLGRLAGILKPGGWLIIEDFDPQVVNRGYATRDADAAALHEKMRTAMGRLMRQRGAEVGWARQLYGYFRSFGLENVAMDGHMSMWQGGSTGAQLDWVNFDQMKDEAIEVGLVTQAEVDRMLELLDDPDFEISSPLLLTAWGQKPAHQGS